MATFLASINPNRLINLCGIQHFWAFKSLPPSTCAPFDIPTHSITYLVNHFYLFVEDTMSAMSHFCHKQYKFTSAKRGMLTQWQDRQKMNFQFTLSSFCVSAKKYESKFLVRRSGPFVQIEKKWNCSGNVTWSKNKTGVDQTYENRVE